MRAAVRVGKAEKFIGHSVQVANVENREAGREMVRQLEQQGLENPFIVGNEEIGFAIALGIFTEAANAEKVELQARSAGFNVEITPMLRDRDAFWVDIALPPGRGAGSIVEKHGEELVALRDAATCP
jgi:cell division septation protein DedD